MSKVNLYIENIRNESTGKKYNERHGWFLVVVDYMMHN